MELIFKERNVVEINDAPIIFRNFEGRGDKFNVEGNRNFAVRIPNRELADALINDANELGAGWNVKIKDPKEGEDEEFIFLKVKIKFNSRGPAVYLESGDNVTKLDEDSIGMLDNIDIAHVDLDIRPYDDEINGKPFRAAYLQSMRVVQNIDRFTARYNRDRGME